MAPDTMTIALTLIFAGSLVMVACHGWWRNPTDHLTRALSFFAAAAHSLFAKGRQS